MEKDKYKQELGRIKASDEFLKNTKQLLLAKLEEHKEAPNTLAEHEQKKEAAKPKWLVLARRHSKQIMLAACALVLVAGGGVVFRYLQTLQGVPSMVQAQNFASSEMNVVGMAIPNDDSDINEKSTASSNQVPLVPYNNEAPPNAVSDPVQTPEDIEKTRNIWVADAQANSVPETMPVYGTECNQPENEQSTVTGGQSEALPEDIGAGALLTEEMEQKAQEIAVSFKMMSLPVQSDSIAVSSVASSSSATVSSSSSASSSSKVASSAVQSSTEGTSQSVVQQDVHQPPQPVVLQTQEAEITVFPNGAVTVLFLSSYQLDIGAPPAPEAELEKHEQYLSRLVAELDLGLEDPVFEVQRDYTADHKQVVTYLVYQKGSTLVDTLLQRDLFSIEIVPDEKGISAIYLNNDTRETQLMEYPVLTLEEAQQILINGEAFTDTAGAQVPTADMVAKVELTYELAEHGMFLPYYRFYVEVPLEDEGAERQYSVWYVPAIRPEYWK